MAKTLPGKALVISYGATLAAILCLLRWLEQPGDRWNIISFINPIFSAWVLKKKTP